MRKVHWGKELAYVSHSDRVRMASLMKEVLIPAEIESLVSGEGDGCGDEVGEREGWDRSGKS